MLCRGLCYVGLCCVEQNLYGSDAVSARDLIFLLTSDVYVQVRVVISRADRYISGHIYRVFDCLVKYTIYLTT